MNASTASSSDLFVAASRPPQSRGRLMLGLTARYIRAGGAARASVTSAPPKFIRLFGASALDRLQPTLTRYHD